MSQAIYQGQTKLRIRLNTNISIDVGDTLTIKGKRPDDSTFQWVCTVIDFETGLIEYKVQTGDLDVVGEYVAWAHISDVGGDVAAGYPFNFTVKTEGEF